MDSDDEEVEVVGAAGFDAAREAPHGRPVSRAQAAANLLAARASEPLTHAPTPSG